MLRTDSLRLGREGTPDMSNQLYRSIQFCWGGATGFTFASFVELINFQTIGSAVAFVGSVSFTAFSWYLSRKAEIFRLERQIAAESLAFEREKQYLDLLNQIKIQKARMDAGFPAEPQ
jgi:hypothetical protein